MRTPSAVALEEAQSWDVEVRRSDRRRRTVSARLEGNRLLVYLPRGLEHSEEAAWVERMRSSIARRVHRQALNSGSDLQDRAQDLNRRWFGGSLKWRSIEYVTNQNSRFGSCTPVSGTIRLAHTLASMPSWVVDYVLIHELAHLVEASHSPRFWDLVNRYPLTERARGFLIAKGLEES